MQFLLYNVSSYKYRTISDRYGGLQTNARTYQERTYAARVFSLSTKADSPQNPELQTQTRPNNKSDYNQGRAFPRGVN